MMVVDDGKLVCSEISGVKRKYPRNSPQGDNISGCT